MNVATGKNGDVALLNKILSFAIFTISRLLLDFASMLPSYFKMKRNKYGRRHEMK